MFSSTSSFLLVVSSFFFCSFYAVFLPMYCFLTIKRVFFTDGGWSSARSRCSRCSSPEASVPLAMWTTRLKCAISASSTARTLKTRHKHDYFLVRWLNKQHSLSLVPFTPKLNSREYSPRHSRSFDYSVYFARDNTEQSDLANKIESLTAN